MLLGLEARSDLEAHPKVGASWEGFVLQELIHHIEARPDECFFWGTHAGAELDLLVVRGNRRLGFEVKRSTAPRASKSLHSARATLDLDSIDVIHAGEDTFQMAEGVRAVAFTRLIEDVAPLDTESSR